MRKEAYAPPPWLPDWRDDAVYTEKLTDRQWRWQRLRRQQAYQELWQRHCEDDDVVRFVEVRDGRTRVVAEPDHESTAVYKTLWCNGAADSGMRCLMDPAIGTLPAAIEQSLWNNSRSNISDISSIFRSNSPPTAEEWRRLRERLLSDVALVVFDLRFNIQEQFDIERGWLKVHQRMGHLTPVRRRQHKTLWRTYLRVLDARSAGAPYREIAESLDLLSDSERCGGVDPARRARKVFEHARDWMNTF